MPDAKDGAAAAATQDLVLLAPHGRVREGRILTGVPAAVAHKMVADKVARPATRRDMKIGGGLAVPYTEEE